MRTFIIPSLFFPKINKHLIKIPITHKFFQLCLISVSIAAIILTSSIPAAGAEQYYVGQRMEITMRSGPGVSYKVIAMLPSGNGVTMLEYGKDWSRIQTLDGKDGWVLSRYMTKEKPVTLMINDLQEKNRQLSTTLEKIKAENIALLDIKEKLVGKEKEYNALKLRSSDFLEIEQKYNDTVKQLEAQKVLIERCNSQSHKEILYSFSIGAGVLIIGIILGISAKKRQKSSFL